MSTVDKLSPAELKLADIIWANPPMLSPELVKLAEQTLGWKRTTTYTVLKRMCGKGIMYNDNSKVCALLSREEYFAGQSRSFIENTFGGSLPMFLASFVGGGKLTEVQADELRRFIEDNKDGAAND